MRQTNETEQRVDVDDSLNVAGNLFTLRTACEKDTSLRFHQVLVLI